MTKSTDLSTGDVEKKKSVLELFSAYSDSEESQVSEVEEEACNTLSNLSNEEEEEVVEVDKSSPVKKRLRSSAGPDEFARIAPESKRKKTTKVKE